DVVPLFPVIEERWDQDGWMLKVRVERDDDIARRVFEASCQSRLMADVSTQCQIADARVGRGQRVQDLQRAVARAVVDVEDLNVVVGPQAIEPVRPPR